MKIFGVNDRKEVVPIDLPIVEVVRNRIHPWWVDIFEPHPVMHKVGGACLALTRIRNFSFQVINGAEALVGVLKDGEFQAFVGVVDPRGNNPWLIRDPRPTRRVRFETAFARFVETYEQADKSNKPPACSQGGLRVERGNLLFMTDLVPAGASLNGPAFTGRMFEGLRLARELPPEINWVFKAFQGWHPTVIGGALRDAVSGHSPADVDFIVDHRGVNQSMTIKACLEKIGAVRVENRTNCDRYGHMFENPVFRFWRGGVQYDLISRGNPLSDRFWCLNDFSVTQLRSDRPNEVTASRVALHDLGNRQCRLVSLARARSGASGEATLRQHWPDRAKKMQARGFKVIANPFATDEYDTV